MDPPRTRRSLVLYAVSLHPFLLAPLGSKGFSRLIWLLARLPLRAGASVFTAAATSTPSSLPHYCRRFCSLFVPLAGLSPPLAP